MPAHAAKLKPETAAAFERYIRVTEARMNADAQRGEFLIIDQLPDARRRKAYEQLQRGQVYIEELHTREEDGRPTHIPSGLIHDWAGVIFIPKATLSETVAVLQDYDNHQNIYKPNIRKSKLIERNGNEFKVLLQFFNKSPVTVVVNADFDVGAQFGTFGYESTSCSTRIAEVANLGRPDEHERPVGNDHGYLWRLCTYWHIEEKDGGVYVQNESIALSRTVPVIFAWLINPLIKSIPRNFLAHLLEGTREAVLNHETPKGGKAPQANGILCRQPPRNAEEKVTRHCDLNHSLPRADALETNLDFPETQSLEQGEEMRIMSTADPVLIVSCDKNHRDFLADSTSKRGLRPICCQTLAAAEAILDDQCVSLIFCEDELLDGHFAQLVHKGSGHSDGPPIIIVSRRDDWDAYLRAMRLGAFDYVTLPPYVGELEHSIWGALHESRQSGKLSMVTAA